MQRKWNAVPAIGCPASSATSSAQAPPAHRHPTNATKAHPPTRPSAPSLRRQLSAAATERPISRTGCPRQTGSPAMKSKACGRD